MDSDNANFDRGGIRKRQKAARPGQIIEAALAEFAEKGYAATRLEEVARRIGVSKGTIYVYFTSKEELFKAMVRATLVPLFEKAEQMAAESTAGGEVLLRTVLDFAYAGLVGDVKAREFLRLMIGEASRVPDLAAFYLKEITGRGNSVLLGVLDRGAATGEFSADALARFKAMPEALIAPIVMAALQRLTSNHWDEIPDLEAQRAAHLDLILNGLRPR